MIYHATNLQLVSRACPYALELYEQKVPYSRDVFGVGIAAHCILEAVQTCTNEIGRELTEEEVKVSALGVCERLMTTGRSYDGVPEPPMKPETVFAGQELALDWLLGVEPCQPGARVEQGLGLDAHGQPCGYWKADGLTIRTILDSVRISQEADEESARTVLTVRDWKTAWSTDDSELDTLQRKIQAIAAWRTYGPVEVLRLEVVNLRLQKVYVRDLYREDGLEETLSDWWSAVATTVRALDKQKSIGPRPASPGRGCLRCPFLGACEFAADFIERAGMHRTTEQKAIAFCVATAMRDDLAEQLRVETEDGAVAVHGGIVGTAAKEGRRLRQDAYQVIADEWLANGGETLGLLKALSLGVGNATSMAKVLFFDRKSKADRDAFLESITEPETKRIFGVHSGEKSVD